LDFQQSFFKAKAVKPPVELAPTAVNSAVVIQAGHMVDFVSVHLLRRMKSGVLDIFALENSVAATPQWRFTVLTNLSVIEFQAVAKTR
jgi:hypothetical protein